MNLTVGGGNVESDDSDRGWITQRLYEFRNQIAVVVFGTLIYAGLTGGFGILSSIPQIYIDSLRYVIVAFIPVYLFGDSILDKIQDEDYHLLLELNLVTVDEPPRMFKLGKKVYRDMTVEGRLYRTPVIDVCVSYDMDKNHAEGVWLSELSDVELLRFKSKLKEARNKMTNEMLEGVAKQETARSAAISAQIRLIEAIMEALADKTSINGADLNKEINDTVDDAMLHDIADEVADDADTVEASDDLLEADTDDVEQQLEQAKEMAKLGGEQ